jgi:uncharacterized UPF0160 family protein
MRVATHDGSFHADEVFALAALSLLGEPLEIVRTRDREVLAASDVRVDVGFRADPATGDFDHHQREGGGERRSGVRYASFGLVWREHGAALCGGDAHVAARVDESLVQGVDANDTGQALAEASEGGIRAMTVSGVVGAFNPTWEEETTPEAERARFDEAVSIATAILRREIASAGAAQRAAKVVADAVERSKAADPRLVALESNVPWKEVVVTEAPDAEFVVYPKRQGWGLEAVPRELGSFDNRRDLPAEWAGLDGPALAELTGVPDALFAHAKRFLVVARTREGIDALAERALRDAAG